MEAAQCGIQNIGFVVGDHDASSLTRIFDMHATFEHWFAALIEYAKSEDQPDLVNEEDPDSYLEYFEDGDSPEEAYFSELDASSEYPE